MDSLAHQQPHRDLTDHFDPLLFVKLENLQEFNKELKHLNFILNYIPIFDIEP